MPSRIVREGINTSRRINALTPLAELFYRRLMNVADDYGRFYASPVMLRTHCWPMCPDRYSDQVVTQMLIECLATDNPLIIRYENGGVEYLEIQNFGQQRRNKSKFPDPKESTLLSNCIAKAQPSRSRISYFGVDSRESEARVEDEPALAPQTNAAEEIRKHALVEVIVRGLAEQQPNPQDFDIGVDAAMREVMSSANPEITVKAMRENLPQWWEAMREGHVRTKPMRYVIVDKDYLRAPPKKASKPEKPRIPNYRGGEIE